MAAETLERRVMLAAVPVGAEFQVNTHTPGDQGSPAVAADADGDFVIAWESAEQDGSGFGVYGQRFNAEGVAQGAEFRVNTFTTDAQSNPAIAMDADGDFVIAWTSAGQDGSAPGVYAQRYNASGVAQGDEFRVNSFTTGEQAHPRIAMDADGDFVIAWDSLFQDGAGFGVFAQRFNAAGVPQGDEFRVNAHTTAHQFGAAPAMDDDGDFVIAWTSEAQDGSAYGVYAQRYNASGVAQGGAFRVNTYTTSDQAFPSVAMDADGDFVVAWSSYFQDASHWGTYAQRFDANAAPQGPEFRVNTFTTDAQFLPAAVMDDDGNFVIVWSGETALGVSEIAAQAYDRAGTPDGGEFQVNTHIPNIQQFPAAAMDADGDFIVAWASQYQDGSDLGIFAQRYALVAPPAVIGSEFRFEDAPHALRFTFDSDVSASLGTEDLLVENLTTGQTIFSGDFALAYDATANRATFTYTGNAGGISGVLPDGRYRATLLAAGITNAAGVPLPADHVLNFFFLNGDANHDATVNLTDFNILAQNFGQTPRTFAQGDFNYDGRVNLSDFNILAQHFGTELSAGRSGGSSIGHGVDDDGG